MLGDEDFGPVAEDNLALIDADEKKIEVENQFMQDDAMVNNSAQWVILPIFVKPSRKKNLLVSLCFVIVLDSKYETFSGDWILY